MSLEAILTPLGASIVDLLQRTLDLPPEQWFAVAAILTLWLYLSFVPDRESAAA